MARIHFDDQLKLLHTNMITLGALCEEAIQSAAGALSNGDMELVAKARAAEEEIDRLEQDIENLCLKLLLQQQPVASDLRQISAALKMISDLERISDQSADIANLVNYITIPMSSTLHLETMTQAVVKMVSGSIDAFVRKDMELARFVMKSDDVVDNLFNQAKKDMAEMVKADPESIDGILDMLMVAKYLERIGDHATNVAEWVEYSITGIHPSADEVE